MNLPVLKVLPQLLQALKQSKSAVLIAPPGAGKTTGVAPALIDEDWCDGQIIVLCPRRIAARAAAERMAEGLGERVGETAGYQTRMDSRHSARTRILVMTEAIFVARIIDDPELSGISAVLFDEAHERHLDSDIGLALALESRAILREDMRICVMSATIDGSRFARILDAHSPKTDCSKTAVIESEARSYPLTIKWVPSPPHLRLEQQMQSAILRAWREEEGDILAFLPGLREIDRLSDLLQERLGDALILPLHGQVSGEEQYRAIRRDRDGRRRVVLATAIAETSLTLEGVRLVVDSGLSRKAEFDPVSATNRLVTHRSSQAACTQRAGRAARQGPGIAYRIWEEAAHLGRAPYDPPEIAHADLAPLALSLARWGTQNLEDLSWLDEPPAASVRSARQRLQALGAFENPESFERFEGGGVQGQKEQGEQESSESEQGDRGESEKGKGAQEQGEQELGEQEQGEQELGEQELDEQELGRLTPFGVLLAQMPMDPLSGAAILHGAEAGNALGAAQMVMLTQERRLGGHSEDLHRRLSQWRGDGSPSAKAARALAKGWADRAERLLVKGGLIPDRARNGGGDSINPAVFLALANPANIARVRGADAAHWASAGGRGFVLDPLSNLASAEWLIITNAQGAAKGARIMSAAALDNAEIEQEFGRVMRARSIVRWNDKEARVEARLVRKLGALKISEGSDPAPDEGAILALLKQKALSALKTIIPQDLLARAQFVQSAGPVAAQMGQARERPRDEPERDKRKDGNAASVGGLSFAALAENAEIWLTPMLIGRRDYKVGAAKVREAVLGMLEWGERQRLDSEAPSEFISPAGTKHKIDYTGDHAPSVEVRVQALFGLDQHPMIGKTALLLQLTSPAGRPIQATRDLPGFWRGSWEDVCKDMKGRYPKHRWPQKPWLEKPTLKTKRHK